MADKKNKGESANLENFFHINAQYIKDVSFENPKAPMSFSNTETPKMEVNVDIAVTHFDNDLYEVALTTSVAASAKDEKMFIIELTYAGLFAAKMQDKGDLEVILLVQCPHILFPYARRIISDMTRDGGYAPLYISPIDFMHLYTQNKDKIAKGEATKNATGNGASFN